MIAIMEKQIKEKNIYAEQTSFYIKILSSQPSEEVTQRQATSYGFENIPHPTEYIILNTSLSFIRVHSRYSMMIMSMKRNSSQYFNLPSLISIYLYIYF